MDSASWIYFLGFLLFLPYTAYSSALPPGLLPRQSGSKVPLRILPLGASITWGLKSTHGNGYRGSLREQLRWDGWEVNMVGSKHNAQSTMTDWDVEANSGDTIDMVKAASVNSYVYKPNVVLINAGTNDCRLGIAVSEAGQRMRSLIDDLLSAPGMNSTLIVLSTLLPCEQPAAKPNIPSVNAQYRELVDTMRDEGKSIVLAEMHGAIPFLTYPADYADDTHPNDEGYKKMARIWYEAIKHAAAEGLIVAPAELDEEAASENSGSTCEKDYGDGIYAGGLTQAGSGEEDGIYYHDSVAMGEVFSFIGGEDVFEKIFFGRMFSRDRDDLIVWSKYDGNVRYMVYRNVDGKDTKFDWMHDFMTVNDNCNPAGVHFIDINGDGLDDFVCIALDGTAYASINEGNGNDINAPTFKYMGKWKDREGYDQENVRLGDVDGDGRADYCVVAGNGDISCWRNGWIDDMPKYWQALGKRFTGKGMGDLRGVRLEDINGDGRDDWLWVDDDGQTTTYTNARSCIKGQEGDGLNIVWRPGYHKGQSSGPTHFGMSGFADSGLRGRVHFARVYGEPQDFGLLGRQDYVFIDREELGEAGGETGYTYKLLAWKNVGSGGTKIKADGNRYCNMMGHDDGRMDYIWILSKGDMRIYPNKGLRESEWNPDEESYWGPNYVIFDPAALSIGRDLDRRDLHLVDWDGDGACDIVWTDPENSNRPHLFRNRIKETGDFNWAYNADPAPDLYCDERHGLGFFDRPVHLADLTGNKRADYLCVEPDGRTWGWVQNGANDWEYIDQFKFAEDRDRANLHWADVNGDGRADMIHTNKFNGDGTVWYNRGREDVGGSRFRWDRVGVKYQGAVAGSCTYFPDLDGDGRADMHSITHSMKNTAETWYNRCGLGDAKGDDGPVEDPSLPNLDEDTYIWDYAPDFSNDPYPPYPPLTYEDGSKISVLNLRGTRLFGFRGCGNDGKDMIQGAWNDFYQLAQQKGLYRNFDWSSEAARDFWGPTSGPEAIPDDRRQQIIHIFQSAQQMYTAWWELPHPIFGNFPGRYLWIEVRCSDGKMGESSTDPDNVCGDAAGTDPDNDRCVIGGGTVERPGETGVQAFTEPHEKYTRITFCRSAFRLKTLSDAMAQGRRQSKETQNNLRTWDNRACLLFHEVTHMDYFMGVPKSVPEVFDLEVWLQLQGQPHRWHAAYGAYGSKKVAQYWQAGDPQWSGFFAQRNADNYAFFALAKYVESKIGFYPTKPVGRAQLRTMPRKPIDGLVPGLGEPPVIVEEVPEEGDSPPEFIYPSCPDRRG